MLLTVGEIGGDTELEYVALPVCDPDTHDVGEALTISDLQGDAVSLKVGDRDGEVEAVGQ